MARAPHDLTFDEIMRARSYFTKHVEQYIVEEYQLRTILAEMGQYPPRCELEYLIEKFSKLTFHDFCKYLSFLKKRHMRPEPKDADTLRAYVALGGLQDRGGNINADDLRATCKHFDLTIDIDTMIKEVDEDGSGAIEYDEFKHMWDIDVFEEPLGPMADELQLSRRSSTLKSDAVEELAEEENTGPLERFFFPPIKKVSMVPMEKKKTLRNDPRKSIARLTGSLFPKEVPSDEEKEEAPPAPPPDSRRVSTVKDWRPPSPIVLDFRRGKRFSKKLPSISPRSARNTPRKPTSSSTTPRTARI